jgi:O-antigen chain-terminating methyltransferase
VAGVALPDLLPVVSARDAAEAKVAAIGTVNPRPAGPFNSLIQPVKKLIARMLDWHVREQVEFNRAVMVTVASILQAMNENNRALARLGEMRTEMRTEVEAVKQEAEELKDVRSHWARWREEWERKLSINEVQFLRSVADLQAAFQHRATLMESNFRELTKSQHSDFTVALDRSSLEIQKRLWEDLEKVRSEFEKLIHTELRLIRQRAAAMPPSETKPAAAPPSVDLQPEFDYGRLAERFRGSEDYVREKQRFYLPFFEGRSAVLDVGCGRGEFLELMKEAGVTARGIDLSEECVALCRAKGLQADSADIFVYLNDLADATLDGIFCAQVVEHLPPERIPEMVRLAAAKLARSGLLVIETPNPECLAIFSTHFYLDPTHTRPVPSALLKFYMEEFGLGQIEVHPLSPAVESMPSLAALPEDFREAFFGRLDYAVVGRKFSQKLRAK